VALVYDNTAVSWAGAVRGSMSKMADPVYKRLAQGQTAANVHLLSYVPAAADHSGQYRALELKCTSKTKLRLRAPKGYYGNVTTE
jgi:hypothetical protein